ncbi:9409_t:CDS:1, partial [Funneliformis caledonium]
TDENVSSNRDDSSPRVSCLFIMIALIDDVKDEGIITFKRSMSCNLILETDSHR